MTNSSDLNASISHIRSFSFSDSHRITLIAIYGLVLVVGITGLTFMGSVLRTNIRSISTIALLNLMVAHSLFLLTVPFRIYYYSHKSWRLHHGFCKVVSAMIHIHMYIVFIIYSVFLTVRFLHYYKKTRRTEFYRRLHALGASVAVWLLLLPIMVPLVLSEYGKNGTNQRNTSLCFEFHDLLKKDSIYVFNMILSIFTVIVSLIHACVQILILYSIVSKHGRTCRSQQDFWDQRQNLCFVVLTLTFFAPYQIFRPFYLNNSSELHSVNEVFLAFSSLTCCDLLAVMGRNMFNQCWT